MKRLLPVLFTALLIPAVAVGQNCEVETDEFTGKSTPYCDNQDIVVEEQPAEDILMAQVSVIAMENMQGFLISVVTQSEGWNFLQPGSAFALVDGARHEFKTANTSSEVLDQAEGVLEQTVIVVPRDEALAMSRASTIRVKIDQAVFRMDAAGDQIAELLELDV